MKNWAFKGQGGQHYRLNTNVVKEVNVMGKPRVFENVIE